MAGTQALVGCLLRYRCESPSVGAAVPPTTETCWPCSFPPPAALHRQRAFEKTEREREIAKQNELLRAKILRPFRRAEEDLPNWHGAARPVLWFAVPRFPQPPIPAAFLLPPLWLQRPVGAQALCRAGGAETRRQAGRVGRAAESLRGPEAVRVCPGLLPFTCTGRTRQQQQQQQHGLQNGICREGNLPQPCSCAHPPPRGAPLLSFTPLLPFPSPLLSSPPLRSPLLFSPLLPFPSPLLSSPLLSSPLLSSLSPVAAA